MNTLLTRLQSSETLDDALQLIVEAFHADSGTIHMIGDDACLHLRAASAGIPEVVRNVIRVVPVGKGMAGLAAQRGEPVTVCNLQTDTSCDVRPGAKATGLEGAIVVPMFEGDKVVGTLGVANRNARTFSEGETDFLVECGRILANVVSF